MGRLRRLPDFNALMELHQTDPEGFEEFRKHVLNEAVNNSPRAQRPALTQLLGRIEIARSVSDSPMESAYIAFRMMQDSLNRLSTGWENALHAVAGLQAAILIERCRSK